MILLPTAVSASLLAHFSFKDGYVSSVGAVTALSHKAVGPFLNGSAFIDVPLALTGAQPRTVCLRAWIDGGGTLFYSGTMSPLAEFGLRLHEYLPGVVVVNLYGEDDHNVHFAPQAGGCHHFCLRYNATAWALFVNGTFKAERVVELNTGPSYLRLGARGSGFSTLPFTGSLDDVFVYDHALTDTAIHALAVV